jgi:hypothetical protein
MNKKRLLIILVSAFLSALSVQTLQAQVRTPDDRLNVISKARLLVYPDLRTLEEMTEGMVTHPFHPRADTLVAPGETTRSVLARIASGISVDGSIQMGGVRYLLLQGRRVGPGDYLPVQHEGRTYQVRIEAVTASSYTLRLNDEEIENNL